MSPPARTRTYQCSPNRLSGDFRDGLRLFLQGPAGGAHGGGLFCRIIQVCSEHHFEFKSDVARAGEACVV